MNKRIVFFVPHKPYAQPRHRDYNGRRISAVRDHPVHDFRNAVQVAFLKAKGLSRPMDGPVELRLLYVFGRSKAPKGELEYDWMTAKPDVDNLQKSVMDALTGLAYTDDCKVAEVHTRKVFGGPRTPEGVWIAIGPAVDPNDNDWIFGTHS